MVASSMTVNQPRRTTNGTGNMNGTNHSTNGNGATSSGSPSPQDKLVVGVDFGTTYSGVAAAYSATPDDVDIIKTWPGGNGITSDKVPTEIAYDVKEIAGEQAADSKVQP